MHKFKSYIIIPCSETFCNVTRLYLKVLWRVARVLHLMRADIFPLTSPFGVVHLSPSLTGLMRRQHRGHPLLYCSLFMLNLNVLSVPGHYLTPCPWAATASLFNSLRWQEVRDCAGLLSHTASGEKHSSIHLSRSPPSSSLASLSIFLPLFIQIAADKV